MKVRLTSKFLELSNTALLKTISTPLRKRFLDVDADVQDCKRRPELESARFTL